MSALHFHDDARTASPALVDAPSILFFGHAGRRPYTLSSYRPIARRVYSGKRAGDGQRDVIIHDVTPLPSPAIISRHRSSPRAATSLRDRRHWAYASSAYCNARDRAANAMPTRHACAMMLLPFTSSYIYESDDAGSRKLFFFAMMPPAVARRISAAKCQFGARVTMPLMDRY